MLLRISVGIESENELGNVRDTIIDVLKETTLVMK